MGAYATPAVGALVRGYLRVGGRMVVGPIRGVSPGGVDVLTAEAPALATGRLRCLGPPGTAAVAWDGALTRVEGAIRVAWPAEGADSVWADLRGLLGLGPAEPLPAEPAPPVEVDEHPSGSLPDPGSLVPGGSELPSIAPGSWPRASVDALQTALASSGGCVRTPVLHVPARPLAVALRRSPGDLSPMIEIDGAAGLRPRDVVAARVALGETALFLEGTVVTSRGSRARLRLAIPSEAARAALEGAK